VLFRSTGTSQEYRDAWFIGYTPELVASVWVGYPQGQIAMTDVHEIKVTGGTFPAQIWSYFMSRALEKKKPSSFTSKDYLIVRICPVSMLLASPYCPSPLTLSLRKEFVPGEYCGIHVAPPTSTLPNQLPR
jgi:penicillin-binding protein 1A